MEEKSMYEKLEKIKEIVMKIEKSIKKEFTSDTIAVKRIEEIILKLENVENIKKDSENLIKLEKLLIFLKETINDLSDNEKENLSEAIETMEEIKKKIKIKKNMIDEYKKSVTTKIQINEEICKSCGLCQKACPVGAIMGELREKRVIEQRVCVKCKACVLACPFKAIEIIKD